MLDLSQLENGSFRLNIEAFNLVELAKAIELKFMNSLQQKDIRLKISFQKDNFPVCADIMRIEQVFMNIMSNAVKHAPQGGMIKMDVREQDGRALVAIENTGEHIPEDELEKIWERFYKIDKSRHREMEGTGLGLSIVKDILELHGSNFGAANTDDGVKFYFDLEIFVEM